MFHNQSMTYLEQLQLKKLCDDELKKLYADTFLESSIKEANQSMCYMAIDVTNKAICQVFFKDIEEFKAKMHIPA